MDQNSFNKRQISEDEIDLGKLFEKIGQFFLNILLVFIKNLKALLSFVVIGIALSLVYFFIQKPVFITEMLMTSKFLKNDYCSTLIFNLNNLVEDGNYNQIEHLLKIDKDLARNINKIEFKNFNEKYQKLDEDTILLKVPFKVKVEVEDNKVLDTLGESIANFIATNKYAKKRERIEIDNLKSQIEKLQMERSSLDSLKKMVSKSIAPRESKAGFVYGEPYEPLNIYKEEIIFFNKELELRKELVESESVEIIQNFTKFKTPRRPISWVKSLFWGIVMGIVFGLVYIIIKEMGSAVKRYEQKKLKPNVF